MRTGIAVAVGAAVVAVAVLIALTAPLRQSAAQQGEAPRRRPPCEGPIVAGKLLSVKVWQHPVETARENRAELIKGGRVEVYDRFIVLTDDGGDRMLHFHSYYTELRFRSE